MKPSECHCILTPTDGFITISKDCPKFSEHWNNAPMDCYVHTADNPTVKIRDAVNIFEECRKLLAKKGADYSYDHDYHSNFKFAEYVGMQFPDKYVPYGILIGVKLARLAVLLHPSIGEERQPNFESIDDSFVDLINYCALMFERYKEESNG